MSDLRSDGTTAAAPSAGAAEGTAVIHDLGYRRYEGERLGRWQAVLALTLHSLRGAFGLGRTARAKVIPFMLLGVMMLPAVVHIAGMALAQQEVVLYPHYMIVIMQPVLAIFLAAQAPYLVAPDLRFRVLPVYLSRPVQVIDYLGAKVAAMAAALLVLTAVPLTVMFVGELLVNLPGDRRTGDFVAALVSSAVLATLLAALGVAVASLTPRRGLGVASVIGLYLLSSSVSTVLYGVLESLSRDDTARWALLLNPFFLVDAVQVWLFGTPPAVGDGYPAGVGGPLAGVTVLGLIALAIVILNARYRKAARA
jgi:ABC-2 type transport system permease protein